MTPLEEAFAGQQRDRQRTAPNQQPPRRRSGTLSQALGVDSQQGGSMLTGQVNNMLRSRGQNPQSVRNSTATLGQGQDLASVFRSPVTGHQTQFNMPGFRAHGASYTQQPTGQPRAIDTPAFPVDNRQLVQPRTLQEAMADRQQANYRMAATYTGQHYPTQSPSSFGNRDGSDPGSPQLGHSREALMQARAQHADPSEGYDLQGFLAKQAARDQELQARSDLRQRRGIERGEARHQAQINQTLNPQQGMSPLMAVLMQRRPEVAAEMVNNQQRNSLLAQQLGLEDRRFNAGLDLQRQQLAGTSGLNDARTALTRAQAEREAAQTAMLNDPERIAREEAMANAERMLLSPDPTLSQQGSRMMAEAMGVPDPSLMAAFDSETGELSEGSVGRVAQHLWDTGLVGQDAVEEAERLGVPESELYRYADAQTPGFFGRFFNRVDERFRGDRARAENFRQQAPVMNLRDALGMGPMN